MTANGYPNRRSPNFGSAFCFVKLLLIKHRCPDVCDRHFPARKQVGQGENVATVNGFIPNLYEDAHYRRMG